MNTLKTTTKAKTGRYFLANFCLTLLKDFRKNKEIPYHIIYWIKLEIKEYKKEIAKEQGKKSFLDKTIIIGKKIGKYILSHVQKH